MANTALEWAEAICAAVEDMDRKMTPYGEGEYTDFYVLPAGPWHRILGLVRGGLWPSYVTDRISHHADTDDPALGEEARRG